MSELATFFHGADTHFGVFYPTHYVLAIFETFEDAEKARQQLIASGWKGEEVIAVPGDDVVHFATEHWRKDGLWGLLMRELSRLFGTEAPYADHDLELAKRGAGFLAVHCRNEHEKDPAWSRLQPAHPLVARYYAFGGIEHLAGEACTMACFVLATNGHE